MRPALRTLLPLAVVAAALAAAVGMVTARPSVPVQSPPPRLPVVEIVRAEAGDLPLRVTAQGSVVPRTESELVAEVSGRIDWVAPSLAPGGFFEAGEVLVRIDPTDYDAARERAEAALVRSESERELAEARLARVRKLAAEGVSSPAALDEAVAAESIAKAAVREARAALLQARKNVERAQVVAPFAGRVRAKHVDRGQFVARGTPVARVYAVDYAEVRLPLPDREAAFVELPIDYRDAEQEQPGPAVRLRARFAGREYTWRGRIVRTEGELDPQTRMIQAVARVEDPYGRGGDPERPPLAVGLFVEAEIEGRVAHDVIALPVSALRDESRVAVVDADGHLRFREVEVVRRERDRVLVGAGLEGGERVCVSPLPVAVEGMPVRIADEGGEDAPPPEPERRRGAGEAAS